MAGTKQAAAQSLSTPEPLWWPHHVADYTGLTVPTLAQMRYTGTGPTFIKLGHQIRYRRSDVEDWLAARTKSRTAS